MLQTLIQVDKSLRYKLEQVLLFQHNAISADSLVRMVLHLQALPLTIHQDLLKRKQRESLWSMR